MPERMAQIADSVRICNECTQTQECSREIECDRTSETWCQRCVFEFTTMSNR